MDYPGNASLTREMQERILSTFEQTLSAASAGNRKEAQLGCDFILRLDAMFEPARQLHDRLESGEGPVETSDLAASVAAIQGGEAGAAPVETAPETAAPAAEAAAAVAETAAAPPPIDELDDLDLDEVLAEVDDAPEPVPQPAAPPPSEPSPASPGPPPVDDLDDLEITAPLEETPPSAEPVAPPATAEPPAPPPAPEPAVAAAPLDPPAQSPAAEAAVPAAPPDPPAAPPAAEPAVPAAPPEPPAPPPVEPAPPPPATAGAEETQAASDETAPAGPPPPAAPPEPEPAVKPPAAAAEPPVEPAVPALDELEDLDLSTAAPATEPETATEPARAAADTAETPEAEAPSLDGDGISLDAEPAAQLDAESEQRIADLLAEGQEAFDREEYQGAIDAWSRIFLIDIDHPEANRRIEEARKLKAESDRQVEERFHEGVAHLEQGDLEAATATFREVVAAQPSHLAARDYLEKLEAGEVPVPVEAPAGDEAAVPEDLDVPELLEAPEEEADGAEPTPERGSTPVGPRMVTVKRSPFKSKIFLVTAAAGVALLAAGGWYLFTNWSQLFPNSEPPAAAAVAQPDPVSRAQSLHAQGKTPMAVAQLRRLPPDHEQYAEAQALIAQWEIQQEPAEGSQGPSPEEQARRAALVAAAEEAAGRREFLRSSELLAEAAGITPLKGPEVQLLAQADEQLQSLQNLISLFRDGEWDFALRDLWLLHESDPGNNDVTRLLVDSYYNLALRDLQRSDAGAAAEKFREAQGLRPDDPELQRLLSFAETYKTRSPDLLYRIFVKYLPFR